MKTKKYFNVIRWLGIAALICTAIILVVMIVESLMPGGKSAAQSDKLTASLQEYAGDRFDQTFVGTEPVREVHVSAMIGFTGTRTKVKFSCIPTDARPTEFIYKIDNTSKAEVDEDGYVTFKTIGQTTITVAVKDDPSICDSAFIYNHGTNPADITSATPNYTSVKEGQIIDGFYLKDQNGNYAGLEAFDVSIEKDAPVRLEGKYLTGMRIGKCNVTFSPKGKPDLKFTYAFETLPNPSLVRATGVTLKTNEITVNKLDKFDVSKYVASVTPANTSYYCFVGTVHNPSGKQVLTSENGQVKVAAKEGTATITIWDNVSLEAKAELTVHVVVPTPQKMNVTGERRVQLNYNYQYNAEGDYCQVDNVVWSVIEGKAQISETGVLSKMHLGKVTIRATFKDDPSVYADITVEVKVFTDFAFFVRKTFGHFALFVVIGFGLAASFAFLIKPRLASVPVAIVSGFAFALLSETLQLPIFTTGRFFAWSDVFVDFFGAIVGMTAAYLVFCVMLLIFRLSKRKSELMTAFNSVSAKTMFKKAPSFEQSASAPQTEPENAACEENSDANRDSDDPR